MPRLLGKGLLAALAAASLLLGAGCGGSSEDAHPSLTITGLGWYEESIDPSFWSTAPASGNTAFYDFFIHYSGEITFTDIRYARVHLPNGQYWNIAARPDLFDPTRRFIGGWGRWYGPTPNQLPIGALRVEVKLTDGVDAQYIATIPAPGSTSAGTYTAMHSQDAVSPPPDSSPMIRRATPGPTNTRTDATQTLSIGFSVADAIVHDGWVWLYGTSGAVVATSPLLVDPVTGLATSRLAGSTLHTDGTMNTLTLSASDLTFATGGSFDQLERFRVVLTDGAQYGLESTGRLRYDCRSISASAPLTVQ